MGLKPMGDPQVIGDMMRTFVVGICHRRTKEASPDADRRACLTLARRLVVQDAGLAPRLHYVLAFDRVGIDVDDDPSYIASNALAVVVMEVWHVLRQLDQSGDVETARREIDKVVRNWADLVAGTPGAIRRPPGP